MRKDRDVNYLVAMDLRGVWRYQRGNQNLYIETGKKHKTNIYFTVGTPKKFM
jgi:hypothetical protein